MNTQTFILIFLFLLALQVVFIMAIKQSDQSSKNKNIQMGIVFIISTMILVSTFYIPKLPSFLGGGEIVNKNEYNVKEKNKEVVKPELKAKDVIDYKNDGMKDLNNSLKGK